MKLPDENELKWFDKNGVARPSHEEHGVIDTFENPLSDKMVSGHARNWSLSGNELSCDTDFGPMTQTISSDYILLGTDEKGLPILKKVLS
jgi:hypothetical protein